VALVAAVLVLFLLEEPEALEILLQHPQHRGPMAATVHQIVQHSEEEVAEVVLLLLDLYRQR
jgi:hypothetical protein